MKCINCSKDTPDTDTYCRHCGTELDLTFDKITAKMGKDIHSEKVAETEAFFRWLLVLTIIFCVSGWLFKGFWDTSMDPRMSPGFIPTAAQTQTTEWSEIQIPIILQEKKK